jgi:signal transduction histidine kinase
MARRLVLALLLAFGLVGVALLAQSYYTFRQEFSPREDSALVKAVQVVATSLVPLRDAHDAAIVLQTIQRQSLMARQQSGLEGILLAELVDEAGRRVYATPELGSITLDAPQTGQGEQQIHGRSYRVAQASAGPWRLLFGEPRLTDRAALSLLLADFMPSLLLAFPFVLLPLWLAVRQGLRPLRQLSASLAQRHENDLSPLAIDMRYAELKPVVDSFNELLAKLQEKVQRERAFVQDAAHELRTPMAVIAAQAHVLARAASEAERHQAEGALEHAIARASHLAQQLLALASLDDARHTPLQHVDLAHLLQTMLAQAMPLARQRGIELSLDAPDSLAIDTDLPALQSIVMNLIDNALRHGQGGADAQVAVSLHANEGQQITLTVADNGPGIPEAERAHIFDRFVRGAAPESPGTGLGLAIVRRAAERLRGTVQIADGLDGQGVAFVVRIPAQLT